jgi:hypothetical protein
MFPNHLPFILHDALVGAGSLWPIFCTYEQQHALDAIAL